METAMRRRPKRVPRRCFWVPSMHGGMLRCFAPATNPDVTSQQQCGSDATHDEAPRCGFVASVWQGSNTNNAHNHSVQRNASAQPRREPPTRTTTTCKEAAMQALRCGAAGRASGRRSRAARPRARGGVPTRGSAGQGRRGWWWRAARRRSQQQGAESRRVTSCNKA